MRTINSIDALRIAAIAIAIDKVNQNGDPIAMADLLKELSQAISCKVTSLKDENHVKTKAKKYSVPFTEKDTVLGFKEVMFSSGTDYGYYIVITEEGKVTKYDGLDTTKVRSEFLGEITWEEHNLLKYYPWKFDNYDDILKSIREYIAKPKATDFENKNFNIGSINIAIFS